MRRCIRLYYLANIRVNFLYIIGIYTKPAKRKKKKFNTLFNFANIFKSQKVRIILNITSSTSNQNHPTISKKTGLTTAYSWIKQKSVLHRTFASTTQHNVLGSSLWTLWNWSAVLLFKRKFPAPMAMQFCCVQLLYTS